MASSTLALLEGVGCSVAEVAGRIQGGSEELVADFLAGSHAAC